MYQIFEIRTASSDVTITIVCVTDWPYAFKQIFRSFSSDRTAFDKAEPNFLLKYYELIQNVLCHMTYNLANPLTNSSLRTHDFVVGNLRGSYFD